MGIRSIKDYQLVRVTAAGQEYAAFSQTEVRELFRMAHQVLAVMSQKLACCLHKSITRGQYLELSRRESFQ